MHQGELETVDGSRFIPTWPKFFLLAIPSICFGPVGMLIIYGSDICETDGCGDYVEVGWWFLGISVVCSLAGWWLAGRIVTVRQRGSVADNDGPALTVIVASLAVAVPWLVLAAFLMSEGYEEEEAEGLRIIAIVALLICLRLGWLMWRGIIRRSIAPFVLVVFPVVVLVAVSQANQAKLDQRERETEHIFSQNGMRLIDCRICQESHELRAMELA